MPPRLYGFRSYISIPVLRPDGDYFGTLCALDQLFKPFWRASSHASNEGLGLGLFIVSEIARSHGGDLNVDSCGHTTRFTFRLKGEQFVERRMVARN